MLRHRVQGILFMLVVVAFVSGIATDVPAKTEGAPPGTKEIPPYIEGTLILTSDGLFTFVGDCATTFDTRLINSGVLVGTFNIQAMTSTDLLGFILNGVPVPYGCFKDGAIAANVVVKSVKNFTPDVPSGLRNSIVARVVLARFQ